MSTTNEPSECNSSNISTLWWRSRARAAAGPRPGWSRSAKYITYYIIISILYTHNNKASVCVAAARPVTDRAPAPAPPPRPSPAPPGPSLPRASNPVRRSHRLLQPQHSSVRSHYITSTSRKQCYYNKPFDSVHNHMKRHEPFDRCDSCHGWQLSSQVEYS